ncbi:MAG: hypothetical protein GX594_00605 [Pirellulaceae bacterium]|nr:hypothetical protein [Pirellulaceae bacterium]
MLPIISPQPNAVPAWHAEFCRLLPRIVAHARCVFRRLDAEARQEAVAACTAHALVAYRRLLELGKGDLIYPSVLAAFAARRVLGNRQVGGRLNVRDISSKYCQSHKGVIVERLDRFDPEENAWREAFVQDTRAADVPETVGFRLDFADWLVSLTGRERRIAEFLAVGNRPRDVVRRFGISPVRVSRLRRELSASWAAFRGEGLLPLPSSACFASARRPSACNRVKRRRPADNAKQNRRRLETATAR